MKKVCTLLVCALLVFSFLVPVFAEDENKTIIENASFFSKLEAQEVVDTEEHRKQTVAVIVGYAQSKTEDELCKKFSESVTEMWGDMKVVIGAYKKGTTYTAIAFRNGDFYLFKVIHFPKLSLNSTYSKYNDAIIEVEKAEDVYNNFEIVMKGLGKKWDVTFYEVSAYDFMSAYFSLFMSDSEK